MEPAEALAMLGGVATRRRLLEMCSRRQLDRAVRERHIVRASRHQYRLPDLDRATRRAVELGGRVAVLSAAIAHGWEVPVSPTRPWVMFDHHGRSPRATDVEAVWGDLTAERGLITSERRTVVDCARRLPFGIALAVADSALRHGVDHETFIRDVAQLRGKGAPQARDVARSATPLAANPFESLLRALAIRAGLDVEPQAPIRLSSRAGDPEQLIHPDLVDRDRRTVIEAESWEFHSGKEAFQRDCWRYTMLVLDGWIVLRFTWWQVVHHPDWVIECLRAARTRASGNAA